MSIRDFFTLSELEKQEGDCNIEVGNRLQQHGYLKIHLDDRCALTHEERLCVNHWESIFRNAFNNNEESKTSTWAPFTTVKGYTVGYRVDGQREFIESRLSSSTNAGIEPEICLDSTENTMMYVNLVRTVIQLCHRIGKLVLAGVAETLGVEESYFEDLVDVISPVPSQEGPGPGPGAGAEALIPDALASSLLRICNYPLVSSTSTADSSDNIAFGAHTDVSLVTIGLCASYPGLEVRDLLTDEWVEVEKEIAEEKERYKISNDDAMKRSEDVQQIEACESIPVVTVFAGDILQLLTRSVYRATAHRVVVNSTPSRDDVRVTSEVPSPGVNLNNTLTLPSRVSCPYILRGRHPAVIPPIASYARFPASLIPTKSHSFDRPPASVSTTTLPSDLPPPPTTVDHSKEKSDDTGASDYPELPDLEGSSMKLIHKLLDLKRQKCLRDNSDNEDENWVLAAYSQHHQPV